MANRIVIKIIGEELTLLTDDAPDYVRKVGAYVNDQMRTVLKAAKAGQTRAAIMTALNIADELFKTREQDEQLRNQIKHYLEESSRQKGEISDLKREVLRLQKAQKKMEQQEGGVPAKPARASRAKATRSKAAKAAESAAETEETGISSKTSRVTALLDKLDEAPVSVEEKAEPADHAPVEAVFADTASDPASTEAADNAPMEAASVAAKDAPRVSAEEEAAEVASVEDAPEDRA